MTATDALVGRAHLYLADPHDWTRGDQLPATLALLTPDERERHARFRVEAPALAFATGRALARRALSLHAEADPVDWRLEPDEHGRPRIVGPDGGPDLDFNLSHNDHLVACLVTGGITCGVDVESPARRVNPLRIAEHSFCEDELRDLKKRAGDDRQRRFFTYWTLKEAYLKARGRGIAMRMDSALFRFPEEGRITVEFPPRVGDRPERWQFALYGSEADQLVATALHSTKSLEIHAFRATPKDPRAAAARLTLERSSRPLVGADR